MKHLSHSKLKVLFIIIGFLFNSVNLYAKEALRKSDGELLVIVEPRNIVPVSRLGST